MFIGCSDENPVFPYFIFGEVTDIDGNTYKTIKIGDEWWMAENLKVTHYRNGDAIPNITDNSAWENSTSGAYCDYNNDVDNVSTYGRIYNWYAINDSRGIAPEGWHVPSDEEWKSLEIILGMSQEEADEIGSRGRYEGYKLKKEGMEWWRGVNSSGFSALPAGLRNDLGEYEGKGWETAFWTSAEFSDILAWYRSLFYEYGGIGRNYFNKKVGCSIRCVKD
jgi:uncharacterized protein (TIGR02145 family)